MNARLLAPLTAAQDGAALDLLDRAFAGDPTLSWYLFAERAGFAQRRRAYLRAYQCFHRANGLPILGAWQAGQLTLAGLQQYYLQTDCSDSLGRFHPGS
ncbi:hypothetical protein LJY18_04230 [Pseudomonas sp. MMS21-TM103]|uniref:hypothetical protein n=1 Tax=Pseudomonas sp. MMS21 TM103 TaxID=2886506 RepID=UPI001EDEAB2A|nr:hypothetical protein [Pseudomonas sp. MMS21 TM103]MCG4452513.1 hypothetical protein [Pseudomonas sp. MMS21 TM103]